MSTLAQGPYSETIKIITQPDSELGQAYATLKSLFDQTKKIYSQQKPFLSADELNIREPEHRATIRTTNLATFVSSVFGGQDVGFYELNDHFIETFVPDGGELQKEPGSLYINLKTQMYLSAVSQEEQERSKEETLDDLFPASLADTLRARHPGTDLTPSEVDFVNEANARREYLQTDSGDADSICRSSHFSTSELLANRDSCIIGTICLGGLPAKSQRSSEGSIRTFNRSLYEATCLDCTSPEPSRAAAIERRGQS